MGVGEAMSITRAPPLARARRYTHTHGHGHGHGHGYGHACTCHVYIRTTLETTHYTSAAIEVEDEGDADGGEEKADEDEHRGSKALIATSAIHVHLT